jgi:hypothetical protein
MADSWCLNLPSIRISGDCTKEDFDRRRAVELKHGRICMFATIGMLWPDPWQKRKLFWRMG